MAISGVSFAIASLIGGWLLNTLSPLGATPHAYVPPLSTMIGGRANLPRDPFLWLFALGCGLRVLTSIWLLLLREPTPQLTAQNKSKC
jgi:hypothetical protein